MLYLAAVGISVIAAVAAVVVAAGWPSGSVPGGRPGGIAGYLLVVLGAISLLPSYDEVPAEFPASVVYAFRTGSFVTQLTLWAVLGVVLAEFAHRLVRTPDRAAKTDPQLATMPS